MFITMDISPISQEVKGAGPTDSDEDPESTNSDGELQYKCMQFISVHAS